jgi:hypothetical protein
LDALEHAALRIFTSGAWRAIAPDAAFPQEKPLFADLSPYSVEVKILSPLVRVRRMLARDLGLAVVSHHRLAEEGPGRGHRARCFLVQLMVQAIKRQLEPI